MWDWWFETLSRPLWWHCNAYQFLVTWSNFLSTNEITGSLLTKSAYQLCNIRKWTQWIFSLACLELGPFAMIENFKNCLRPDNPVSLLHREDLWKFGNPGYDKGYHRGCRLSPTHAGGLWISNYIDVIMSPMTSQITSLTSVYSTVYSWRRSKKTTKLCVNGFCA